VPAVFSGSDDVNVFYKDVHLTADIFDYDMTLNRLHVYDNVVVKRKQLSMTSDHVYFDIPEILRAEGHAHFIYKAFDAFSNKVIYTIDNRNVSFLGNAILKNNDDFVKGEHIVLDLNTEKVVSKGRSNIKISTQPDQR
jgi:Uncharacterized protein conserved in bacteria